MPILRRLRSVSSYPETLAGFIEMALVHKCRTITVSSHSFARYPWSGTGAVTHFHVLRFSAITPAGFRLSHEKLLFTHEEAADGMVNTKRMDFIRIREQLHAKEGAGDLREQLRLRTSYPAVEIMGTDGKPMDESPPTKLGRDALSAGISV